jgi:hypothetical protein
LALLLLLLLLLLLVPVAVCCLLPCAARYLASCVTTPACLMFFTWLLKTGAFAVAA